MNRGGSIMNRGGSIMNRGGSIMIQLSRNKPSQDLLQKCTKRRWVCSFLDYLDISINHPYNVYCFIKVFFEYKINSLTKTFLLRNIQIRIRFSKKFEIQIHHESSKNIQISVPDSFLIGSVPSSGSCSPLIATRLVQCCLIGTIWFRSSTIFNN